MTADKIRQLIEARFGEPVEVSHVEVKRWLMDEKTKQSWREQLMSTFKARLVGARERGVAGTVIEESESLLRHLETFTPAQTLCSLSASSEATYYVGWGIDEAIVFCLPSKK